MHVANIYSNPFQLACSKCNLAIENFGIIQGTTVSCAKCTVECPVNYLHRLNYTIVSTKNAKVSCVLRDDILKKVFPYLIALSYKDYLKDKYVFIYMLHDFFIDGEFTINYENIILDIKR